MYRRALALTKADLGPHDLDTATVLNELGMLRKYTGRFAFAARCYRRAPAIRDDGVSPTRDGPVVTGFSPEGSGVPLDPFAFTAGR